MRTLSRMVIVLVLTALVSLTAAPVLAASPTLPQAQAAGQETRGATVNVASLNVRGGPGTGYRILTYVVRGTYLTLQGQNGAGDWLQVHTPSGYDGWVKAEFVTVAGTDPGYGLTPHRIVAPAIGLDARVVPNGWHYVRQANGALAAEWDVPSYAAGWHINSAHPGETGNVVLSGHHNIEGEVFRYVVNLKAGDQITIYAGNQQFSYAVVDKMILPEKYASSQQRMANARWIGSFDDERLTLVTCWPYTNNTHRVVVVARPVGR